jgi:hypothetical protein
MGAGAMSQYERVINEIRPSDFELSIVSQVKEGIASDARKSPFSSDRWYKHFTVANKDGLSLNKAPANKLLMVVTESLGTFIANGRGTSIVRGSILVKLADNLVFCVDSYSWYASPTQGAITFNNNGYFEYNTEQLHGKVKEIGKVNL